MSTNLEPSPFNQGKTSTLLPIILSQVAVSAPTYVSVLLITKFSRASQVLIIGQLTFSLALAISLCRVLISSPSVLKASGDANLLLGLVKGSWRRDVVNIMLISISIGSVGGVLSHASVAETASMIALFAVATSYDYCRQVSFALGLTSKVLKADLASFCTLCLGFTLITLFGEVNAAFIGLIWAAAVLVYLPSLAIGLRGRIRPAEPHHHASFILKLSLFYDFALGLGLLQIVYVLAPVIATPANATDLRLVLLLTAPSAVLAQAITYSGITWVMGDQHLQYKRLAISASIVFLSTLAVATTFWLLGPELVVRLFGSPWRNISGYLLAAGFMSFTHGLLVVSSLQIRWGANPREILVGRSLGAPMSLLGPAIGLRFGGVNGCLLGLSLSNLAMVLANSVLISKRKVAE